MARGRMVSTTIGESRKFAALASNDHRLMYLMVLPHVDKAGRFEADPIVIKSKCLMRLDVDASTIEAWLKDGASTGLLRVYEVDGLRYLEIVDFTKHNSPHHKEPDSNLPPFESGTPCYTQEPNDEPSMAQAQANHEPSKPIREVKRREVEEEEKERELSSSSTNGSPALVPVGQARRESVPYQELIDEYNANCGALPKVLGLNDDRKRLLKRAVDAIPKVKGQPPPNPIEYLRDATRCVAADEFWVAKRHNLDNLLATANRLTEKAEKWRDGRRVMTAGDAKLASTYLAVARATEN